MINKPVFELKANQSFPFQFFEIHVNEKQITFWVKSKQISTYIDIHDQKHKKPKSKPLFGLKANYFLNFAGNDRSKF